jgi:hypothetical protein
MVKKPLTDRGFSQHIKVQVLFNAIAPIKLSGRPTRRG